MIQRIRYEDHETRENNLISVCTYISKTTGAKYRIVLDLNEMMYMIRNERDKVFIKKSKKYGNLNVLKRNARSALGKLGVALKRESRNRTFGLCDKGTTQDKWEKDNG
jgi:hypothetical protein